MDVADEKESRRGVGAAPTGGRDALTRRRFLARAVGSVVGGIAALLGVPGVAFIVGRSQDRSANGWIHLGAAASFHAGDPTRVTKTITKQSAWVVEEQEVTIFVSTRDGKEFRGLSDKCTHLGCRVRWVPAEESNDHKAAFFCPCHNGVFDPDGQVVSGPLPRPLDRFDMKVEAGDLYARQA